MPNEAQRWSACNYISNPYSRPKTPHSQACLTYWENDIHDIPSSTFGNVFVTLNPFTPPHPRLVQGIWEYTSPELSASALNAHRELSTIQNIKGLSYCGSWTGCNFYEETVTNGLKVATEHLGAKLPFQIVDHQVLERRHYVPYFSLKNTVVRMALRLLSFYIWTGGIVLRLLGLISVVRFTSGSSSNKTLKSA
jgi:Predicted NAD/FAD-binding protein